MHKLPLAITLVLFACSKKPEPSKLEAKPEAPAAGTTTAAGARPEIRVTVDAVGYHPAEPRGPAGKPVRLIMTRTTDDGCGQELVVPSLKLKRELPLNQPVAIDLTMPASGKLTFTCGMDMMRGAIIAE